MTSHTPATRLVSRAMSSDYVKDNIDYENSNRTGGSAGC